MKKISVGGNCLKDVVSELLWRKQRGEDVYCEFNGVTLRSSDVTLDGAYLAVTGMTYSEYQENERRRTERWKSEKEEHKKNIPNLKKHYLLDSLYLINPDQIDEWVDVVDARLSDLYEGFDLASAIEIMKSLDSGDSIEEAKKIIDNQSHSGMSYGIVRLIVKQFSPRGQDFFDATMM